LCCAGRVTTGGVPAGGVGAGRGLTGVGWDCGGLTDWRPGSTTNTAPAIAPAPRSRPSVSASPTPAPGRWGAGGLGPSGGRGGGAAGAGGAMLLGVGSCVASSTSYVSIAASPDSDPWTFDTAPAPGPCCLLRVSTTIQILYLPRALGHMGANALLHRRGCE